MTRNDRLPASRFLAVAACVGCVAASVAGAAAETAPLRFSLKLLAVDTNECCALADVDRDGRTDVIAGRNWYRAPEFVPRPLRPIGEFGKDYSENNGDHAFDVNGDGWVDVVAGSFVPTEVYWYENPGKEGLAFGRQWPAHRLVDTGLSQNEITYLRDLDGDEVPELAVNSWNPENPMVFWKLVRGEDDRPALAKVVVGPAGNGHGMGFGDIDDDGREDIVFEGGWYRNRNPQAGEGGAQSWELRRDWKKPGSSCPMLVRDLDGDGRNDILYGRGHDYGLFWMRQLPPAAGGATRWEEHAIDTSFSQAHALHFADLDGDGRDELITGKRVRAHSGGDPGAADPPVIYAYTWDQPKRLFHRRLIARGQVGTGLQIHSGDLNGDGRTDLVMAGKSGTFILFNEGD